MNTLNRASVIAFAFILTASQSNAEPAKEPATEKLDPVVLASHLHDPEVAKDITKHPLRGQTGKRFEVSGDVTKAVYVEKEKKYAFRMVVPAVVKGRRYMTEMALFFDDGDAADVLFKEISKNPGKKYPAKVTGVLEFVNNLPCFNDTAVVVDKNKDAKGEKK